MQQQQFQTSISQEFYRPNSQSPGPGAYDDSKGIKAIKERAPEWSFAKGERPDGRNDSPGPGTYDLSDPRSRVGGSWSLAGNQVDNNSPARSSREGSPGPGAYDPKNMNKQVAYSMGTKHKDAKGNQVPGPGSYDQSLNYDRNKSYSTKNQAFGSNQKRDIHTLIGIKSQGNLGPGAYNANHNVTKASNPNFKFPQGKKGITSRDISPGPGVYSPQQKTMGKDAVKITMSGKSKQQKQDIVPGPGAYEKPSAFQSRSTRSNMSKARRELNKSSDFANIGPGAYDAKDFLTKSRNPAPNFGGQSKRKSVFLNDKQGLGPGQYDVTPKKTGPSYTMTSKRHQKLKSEVPGPGQYEPNSNLIKASVQSTRMSKAPKGVSLTVSQSTKAMPGPGSYSTSKQFGSDARKAYITGKPAETQRNDSPGPGKYDASDALVKSSTPNYKMGSSKRDNFLNKTQSSNPGPGSYTNIKGFGSEATKVSIRGKPKEQVRDVSPAPGHYDANFSAVKEKQISHVIGKDKRLKYENSDKPGPGAYDSPTRLGKGPKYTMGNKPKDLNGNKNPGPGQYDAKDALTKDRPQSAFISTQNRDNGLGQDRSQSPGPGNYDQSHKTFGKDAPAVTMSGKQNYNHDNKIPGPGQYDAKDALTKERTVSHKMGSSNRDNFLNKAGASTPGPGNYEHNSKFWLNSPQFTMQAKKVDLNDSMSPGPGGYNPNDALTKDRVVTYKMPQTTRDRSISKEEQNRPGPGTYEAKTTIGTGPSVSIRGKKDYLVGNSNPGPGNYEADVSPTKDRVISHKMGTSNQRNDIVSKDQKERPGPGGYERNDHFGKDAVKYSIRGKSPDKVGNDNPGPGNYDAIINAIKEKAASYKMGSGQQRAEVVSKDQKDRPGPGGYENHNQFGKDGIKYSIRGKSPERDGNNNPGPGNYEPNMSPTKDRTIAYKMGSGQQRAEVVSKDAQNMPGPGGYEKHDGFGKDGIKYSIRGKSPDRDGNNNPGPGNYEPNMGQTKDRAIAYKMGSGQQRAEVVSKDQMNLPGPGGYEKHDGFGKDGIKYSIRGKSPDREANNNPGPGNYDPNLNPTKDRSIAHKMGSGQQRAEVVSKDAMNMPGPGGYEKHDGFGKDGIKYSIRGKSPERLGNENPGPGNYNDDVSPTKDRVISYKMGSSQQRAEVVSKDQKNLPGPGGYEDHNQFGKQGAKYSILGKYLDQKDNGVPGPGNYEGDVSPTKDRVISYKMGSSQQRAEVVSKDAQNMPGPGGYEKNDGFGKDGIKYSIRGKSPERIGNNNPGPGNYNDDVSPTKDRVISYKMGSGQQRAEVVSKDAQNMPGPGGYEKHDGFGKDGLKYTISGKPGDQKDNGVPGPGNYNEDLSPTKDRVISYKMGSSQQRAEVVSKDAQNMPGPGGYEKHDGFGKDGIKYSIRGKSPERVGNNNPGPGNYNDDVSPTKDRVISYKMGSGQQRAEVVSKDAQNMPGPGGYEKHDGFGKDGLKYTFQGKPGDLKDNGVPGPGNYNEDLSPTKDRVISYKMGSSPQRGEVVSKDAMNMPGPGGYEKHDGFGKDGVKYTFSGKPGDIKDNGVPGPGNYNDDLGPTKDRVVSYKMGSSQQRAEVVSKDAMSMPGPGGYEKHDGFGKDGIKYSIRGKSPERQGNDNPGPGNYNDDVSPTKDRVISYKMGSSQQRAEVVSKDAMNMPGPGGYEKHDGFGKDGLKYTFQGKPGEIKDNGIPGPGNYNGDVSPTKDRVVSYKMGSSQQRADVVSKDAMNMPGPGGYEKHDGFGKDGLKYTFQGKPSDLKDNGVPGPGNYNEDMSPTKDRVISYKLGSSPQRAEVVSADQKNLPGPGGYDEHNQFGKGGLKYSIAGKSPDKKDNGFPGPGNYEQDVGPTKDRVIAYKMGSGEARAEVVSKDQRNMPGPGGYENHDQIGKDGPKYTIRGKSPESRDNGFPGPGTYEQDVTAIKDKSLAYKMGNGPQRNDMVGEEMRNRPGPGAYDSPSKLGGPSFKMGERLNEIQDNQKPGPGTYDPKDFLTKDRPPTAQVGTSGRGDIVSRELATRPGPGTYSEGKKFGEGVPTSSIRGKPTEISGNDFPGPGTYESNIDPTRCASPSYKQGKSRRDFLNVKSENGGPPFYDVKLDGGIAYTIQEKRDQSPDNGLPGPGTYNPKDELTKCHNPEISFSGSPDRKKLGFGSTY